MGAKYKKISAFTAFIIVLAALIKVISGTGWLGGNQKANAPVATVSDRHDVADHHDIDVTHTHSSDRNDDSMKKSVAVSSISEPETNAVLTAAKMTLLEFAARLANATDRGDKGELSVIATQAIHEADRIKEEEAIDAESRRKLIANLLTVAASARMMMGEPLSASELFNNARSYYPGDKAALDKNSKMVNGGANEIKPSLGGSTELSALPQPAVSVSTDTVK